MAGDRVSWNLAVPRHALDCLRVLVANEQSCFFCIEGQFVAKFEGATTLQETVELRVSGIECFGSTLVAGPNYCG
jgi:hypothetical protein